MLRYIEGTNRNQLNIIPVSLEELIAENNSVRVIDALVDSLDMESLDFKYALPKETGRKAYDPKHMLKLYIYGYYNGIRTTRKLEKECKRNIEVMWLLDNLMPDDKTISNFRKDNKKAITEVFKQFSMLCNELGLYGKEVIAVDGSKFRANNSRRKNYTKNKVKKMLEHYEETAKKYIELLNVNDEKEKNEKVEEHAKQEISAKLEAAKKRIEELTQMAEEIEKNGEISITDPDAKHMSVSNNGTDIAHNVQIAVDSKNHLVVAVDVVSTPADQNQLHNMSSKAVEELGLKENENNDLKKEDKEKDIITVLADKGYYCGEELEKCRKDHMKVIVPKQKSGSRTGNEEYVKDNFKYDAEEDIYICPSGEELQNISKPNSKDKVYRNTEACNECKHKDKCTTSKKGRIIKRGPYQETYDEVDKVTLENKELYRQRQMIVEHPFGTVKRALGFSYFLTRGNENVKAESCMHFFTYNLIRVINIIGIKELIKILKAKKQAFFTVFYHYTKLNIILTNNYQFMTKKARKTGCFYAVCRLYRDTCQRKLCCK